MRPAGLLAALALWAGAPVLAATEAPHAAGVEFLPASDIHPGMKGVARTVFEGDRLEEFEVEFLGVLKNAIGPQQDMILARLKGEKVEFTGVVAGMSGSPVYVDGKLVGALSYRIGSFAKEPIAGITPISDMLKVADAGNGGGRSALSSATGGGLLGWLQRGADRGNPPAQGGAFSAGTAAAQAGLQPISTPLVCSGCDQGILRYYAPIFEVMGLTPTSGGGASGAAIQAGGPPLVPGSAIGAALATGDLNLAGVGTLTHVDGDQVFAFGHPMLGGGTTQLPMTRAEVILTLASAAGSFKIANTTQAVGTIVEDRLTAIVGRIGQTAPMMPLTVRVRSGSGGRSFHYDVIRDRSWAPVMVALTTANSLMRTMEYNADATLALRYRIDIEGYPEVRYEDLYSGTNPTQPVHALVANDAGGLLGLLYNNSFEAPPIVSAEADIELLDSARVASLSSLSASVSEVRPGEPFRVVATLSPFRGVDQTVTFEVVLPEDTPSGDLQLMVGGGSALDGMDRRVQDRQLQQAANLRDVIRVISRQRRSDALYLRVMRRAPSAIVRSEILPELPLSVFNVLNNPRLSADSTLLVEAPILELSKEIDLVAIGGRRITLKVQ